MKVPVYSMSGQRVGEQELNPKVFGVAMTPELVHQVVTAEQSNARQPLAHTKTRADVRGGGKKPWKQKGTGRARQGSIRSPQWRGGGVVFGPRKERNYTVKINKKMKRQAVLMALSAKVGDQKFVIVEHLDATGKTNEWNKNIVGLWKAIGSKAKRQPTVILMVPTIPDSIKRATKNVKRLEAIRTDSLNLEAILKHEFAVTTVDGAKNLEQWFLKEKK